MQCALFAGFFLLALINQGLSVRITRFVVPRVASHGALLDLDCAYDLENAQLYDVKWYKDNEEFFRCKFDGQVQEFEVDGIKLYHNHQAALGSCPVTLTVLDGKSGGHYRCEVSTEGPEFKTAAQSVSLKIKSIEPSRRIQSGDNSTPPVNASSTQKSGNIGSQTVVTSNIVFEFISFYILLIILK